MTLTWQLRSGRQAPQPPPVETRLQLEIRQRRQIYTRGRFACYVASNAYTRFRPSISPEDVRRDPCLRQKLSAWLRRELRVFTFLSEDSLEWLRRYILSLMEETDLQSDEAFHSIEAFLGERTRHFIHETMLFARSPFTHLSTYDRFVQYGGPQDKDERTVRPAHPSGQKRQMLHQRLEAERSLLRAQERA